MLLSKKQKFLFKCDSCSMILTMEFEEAKELADLKEDKILLECPCGGMCFVLRD
jgi:hypothetical protein